jgi:acetyl-CoA carboxylase biotin carboxyl carrier protein
MDIRRVKRLIALLDGSGVMEIEIKQATGGVRISCGPRGAAAQPPHCTRHRPPAATHKLPAAAPRLPVRTGIATLDPSYDEHVITAPIVGTFYGSPVPGTRPFVRVGDAITRGQVLCIIDAMKLTHEVQSDRSGRVMWIMARSGEPVEFAQPLFVLQ